MACGDAPVTNSTGLADQSRPDSTELATTVIARQAPMPDCPVNGKVLEGNTYYSVSQDLFIAITADSTTRDEQLGASHRKLLVYNANNCQLIEQETLPVDRSPDFNYQIADINYNSSAQQLAIRGTTQLYVYDLQQKTLTGPFKPQFSSERYGIDAQSGNIQQLEVWESYLIGYVQDYGAFVFKLNDKDQPVPVFPMAEYQDEMDSYSQAFLLPSDRGAQVILPTFNRRDRLFRINPVFEQPVALDPQTVATAQDNRFLLLRENDGNERAIVIDLKKRERADLPADIERKGNEDILDWMEVMQ